MSDVQSERLAEFQAVTSTANFLMTGGQAEIALKLLESALQRIAAEQAVSEYSETARNSFSATESILIRKYNEAAILAKYKQRTVREFIVKSIAISSIVAAFTVLSVGIILKMVENTFKMPMASVVGVLNDQIALTAQSVRNELPRGSDKLAKIIDEHMERGLERKIESVVNKKLPEIIERQRQNRIEPNQVKPPK